MRGKFLFLWGVVVMGKGKKGKVLKFEWKKSFICVLSVEMVL